MIDLSIDITGALHSYPHERNDLVLMDNVNFPVSSWEKMDNNELLTNYLFGVGIIKGITEFWS